MLRFALFLAFVTILDTAPLRSQEQPVTVFVVRHAEKADASRDPSLSAGGRARAEALARLLADAGINTIYVTQYKRTLETAAPLAARNGVTPKTIDAADMAALVGAVRALPPGSRVLIASHSNLVPVIVQRLSGVEVGEMPESEYDRLYVVTKPAGDAGGSVLYLHVGEPSAATR